MRSYLSVFLSSHASLQEKDKARSLTLKLRRTRRTTYIMLRALEHALQFIGKSLTCFIPTYEFPRPLTRVEKRYSVVWNDWPYEVPEGVTRVRICVKNSATGVKRFEVGVVDMVRPVCGLSHDRHSVNMGAINFAKHDLHCRVTSTSDPFHDTWNDIQGAIEDCGEWGTVVDLGHCFNLATGPWDSWAFFVKCNSSVRTFYPQWTDAMSFLRACLPGLLRI